MVLHLKVACLVFLSAYSRVSAHFLAVRMAGRSMSLVLTMPV
jgi:hypothetical protein